MLFFGNEKERKSWQFLQLAPAEAVKIQTFVPGRLVPDFVVDETIEVVVKNLVDVWQGVVGYSLDGDSANATRKQKEADGIIAHYGITLRSYLKPYCELCQLVGKDQIQRYKSCRVGVPDDEQNRWYAAGVLCSYDKEN